jgi:hypothetical protein
MTNGIRNFASTKTNKACRTWEEDQEFQAKKRKGENIKKGRKHSDDAKYVREEL